MPDLFPLFLTVLLYAGLGGYFWTTLRDGGTSAPAKWEKPAILLPLALHAWLLYHLIFQPAGLTLGVGHAISAIAWLTVLVYWLGSLHDNLEGLQGFVLPFAAVGVAAPWLLPATHTLEHSGLTLFKLHMLIAVLAYSLLTIASLHALLMTLVERRLHGKPKSIILRRLPPLLTMEHLLFRILWAGFFCSP